MGKSENNLAKISIVLVIIGILAWVVCNKVAGFYDGILNYNDTLQKRTRIWGDLNDDALGMIQRMTEPDIGYYPSKMKLVDYADVIV